MEGYHDQNPSVMADFTEDANAGQTINCGRSSCNNSIKPDEERFAIQSKNSGQIKMFCKECYAHVLRQPTTLRTTQRTNLGMLLNSFDDIRSHGCAVQTVHQGPPVPQQIAMGPPHLPSVLSARGQSIDVGTIRQNVNEANRKGALLTS